MLPRLHAGVCGRKGPQYYREVRVLRDAYFSIRPFARLDHLPAVGADLVQGLDAGAVNIVDHCLNSHNGMARPRVGEPVASRNVGTG